MSSRGLFFKVLLGQLLFSAGASCAIILLSPTLLLLSHQQSQATAFAVALALGCAFVLSGAFCWTLIRRRRRLLSQLSDKRKRRHQHIEIPKLNDDPWHLTNAWMFSGIFSVLLAMTAIRPAAIPLALALTISLFSAIILAAGSLPLLVIVRRAFVHLMEQVPSDIMADIIDAQVRSGRLRGRTSRRLLAAITTPVGFIVIGSVLIASSHARALEEEIIPQKTQQLVAAILVQDRKQTDGSPDELPGGARSLTELSHQGYQLQFFEHQVDEPESTVQDGIVELLVPSGRGSLQVLFAQDSDWATNFLTIPVTLLALFGSIWTGLALARLLSRDLKMANHGVRMLGTDAALEGTRVMQPARFQAVAELGQAIEQLSDRFRQFAHAQSLAVEAREAATRSRGRFFASVSHDLKSPLNAILGFAEITRADPTISPPQQESLDMILRRGRELLILVETILDAARVEAGQLQLEHTELKVDALLEQALSKARDLTPDSNILTQLDFSEDLPETSGDRLRLAHALSTFFAHSRRTAERDSLRVLVECEPKPERPTLKKRTITIHVEIPSSQFSAKDLESMLHPETHPGQHRGLSLALRLAKSIIELHGGQVVVTGRTVSEPAFAITLFGRPGQ